ncbi:MAG TPA: hypothetical protein VHW72_16565 [Candidatus Angelobacter sp.]|jgi:hypothetical protein|nr:hypothetical protein [Candidatus Angelobacter sp.]
MSDWFKLVTHFSMNKAELILAVLAVAGAVLQACVVLLLVSHRYFRQFPTFGVYLLFSVLVTVVELSVQKSKALLLDVYLISEAPYIFLSFLACQEAFRSVFRNFYSLRWFKLSFPLIGILIVFVALLRAVFFRPAHDNPANVAFISLEIAVAFLQFGVFCVFILLVWFFHMRWQQHAFGIVLGFGIAAAGSLVAFLLRSEFGTILNRLVQTAVPVTYIIGVAIWLATFLREEPSGAANGEGTPFTPEQMITELRRHTKVVKGILGR